MDFGDAVGWLEPLQKHTVVLVNFGGRTTAEAAALLGVERIIAVRALAVALRHIARWVMDDDITEASRFSASVPPATTVGAALSAAG